MAFSVKSNKKSNKTGITCYPHTKFFDSRTSDRTLLSFTNEVKVEGSFPALPAAFTDTESMQIGLPLFGRAVSK